MKCSWCRKEKSGTVVGCLMSHGACNSCAGRVDFDLFLIGLNGRLVSMPRPAVVQLADNYRRLRTTVNVLHSRTTFPPGIEASHLDVSRRLLKCVMACNAELSARSEAKCLVGV